jgi:DNA-binding CsgD family transcriptional regulator/GAF domain-containing protein
MSDKEYFSHLYEIASNLNREFSLPAALRVSLKKTVQLLNLETGWIWLVQADVKSVYLAASYNLPPALSNHPERLSGWCFCIEKYLSDNIPKARNISEITCSRLKNIKSGTRDLKFHATIPITTNGQKAGLINLVSKETQKLNEQQLSLLNTISELIGIAIQRTRVQEAYNIKPSGRETAFDEVIERVLQTRINEIATNLQEVNSLLEKENVPNAVELVKRSLEHAEELKQQLSLITGETEERKLDKNTGARFHYPTSPLTNRELEVLTLIRKGLSNKQIAEQLFLAERTIKFHITSILSKLLAGNRTQAINNAIQRGILSA